MVLVLKEAVDPWYHQATHLGCRGNSVSANHGQGWVNYWGGWQHQMAEADEAGRRRHYGLLFRHTLFRQGEGACWTAWWSGRNYHRDVPFCLSVEKLMCCRWVWNHHLGVCEWGSGSTIIWDFGNWLLIGWVWNPGAQESRNRSMISLPKIVAVLNSHPIADLSGIKTFGRKACILSHGLMRHTGDDKSQACGDL